MFVFSESLVKNTFRRATALINLDLSNYSSFNLSMHLCVTSVNLQMAESLMQAFKLTDYENEAESANQIRTEA